MVVGSKAHGLNTPESDTDYRSVYVLPTKEILQLHPSNKQYSEDFEVQHFLDLATKSNPTILEMFNAPTDDMTLPWGPKLLNLFPHVWSSRGVYNAFKGYSRDQNDKIFKISKRRARPLTEYRQRKACTAMLRVLLQGIQLLDENDFDVKVKDTYPNVLIPYAGSTNPTGEKICDSWREFLLQTKNGEVSLAQIKITVDYLNQEMDRAYHGNSEKKTNYELVNEFLLDLRKYFWRE